MMKKILFLTTIFFGLLTSCAQNKSAPSYLENQKFPDSIASFKVKNIEGNKVTFKEILDSNKGKKIVLDFWASWCKDCIESLPELQELQSKTSSEAVKYVFLSMDKTEDRWKFAIDHYKIEGDHYFMEEGWKNTLTNYINLAWIPSYMVIDEEGIIRIPKVTKVSNTQFQNILLK